MPPWYQRFEDTDEDYNSWRLHWDLLLSDTNRNLSCSWFTKTGLKNLDFCWGLQMVWIWHQPLKFMDKTWFVSRFAHFGPLILIMAWILQPTKKETNVNVHARFPLFLFHITMVSKCRALQQLWHYGMRVFLGWKSHSHILAVRVDGCSNDLAMCCVYSTMRRNLWGRLEDDHV